MNRFDQPIKTRNMQLHCTHRLARTRTFAKTMSLALVVIWVGVIHCLAANSEAQGVSDVTVAAIDTAKDQKPTPNEAVDKLIALPGNASLVTAQSDKTFDKKHKPYFFVVAADPQLLFKQKDDRNWKTTIGHINRLKPDFMIVCGDLVQAPNEAAKWENPENVKAFDKLADMYKAGASRLNPAVKLYNVAGNHDVSQAPTPTTLKWYESRFNTKPWYRFEHKNSLFVVIESNLLRNPTGAPEHAKKQTQFIDASIKLAADKPFDHRTVYMHHPLCLKAIDEKDQYFNVPSKVRLALIKRFKAAGFSAAFCGHYHRNAYVKSGKFEIITTASCGAALGKDPLGFRIVKVYPDRLEHAYVVFGKMPEKIELKQKQ